MVSIHRQETHRCRLYRSPHSRPVSPPPGRRRSTRSSSRSAAALVRPGPSRAMPGCSGRSSGRRPRIESALPTSSPTPTGSVPRDGCRHRRRSEPEL